MLKVEQKVKMDENCFDYIRIIVAVIIFIGHFLSVFNINSPFMNQVAYFIRGVPVFFWLSGFLVARSIEKYSFKDFLKNRFWRIFPSLWTSVLVSTVIIFVFYHIHPSFKQLIVYILTQFSIFQFYTGSWLSEYGVGVPNGPLWTISVDIQFYFLVYWLAFKLKNISFQKCLLIVLAMSGISLVIERMKDNIPTLVYSLFTVSLIPYLYIFLFGMLCYYHKEKIIPWVLRYRIIIGIFYVMWSYSPKTITVLFNGVRYNIIMTMLLMLLVIAVGYSLGRKRVELDYSYAFYLYHMIVLNAIDYLFISEVTSILQAIIVFILGFMVTGIFAILSMKMIEQRLVPYLKNKVVRY